MLDRLFSLLSVPSVTSDEGVRRTHHGRSRRGCPWWRRGACEGIGWPRGRPLFGRSGKIVQKSILALLTGGELQHANRSALRTLQAVNFRAMALGSWGSPGRRAGRRGTGSANRPRALGHPRSEEKSVNSSAMLIDTFTVTVRVSLAPYARQCLMCARAHRTFRTKRRRAFASRARRWLACSCCGLADSFP